MVELTPPMRLRRLPPGGDASGRRSRIRGVRLAAESAHADTRPTRKIRPSPRPTAALTRRSHRRAPAAHYGLSYPCGEPPAPGTVREVAPGVLWLRMPLPFALNHINLWAIADEDEHGPGWAIVDTGTKTPEVVAAWRDADRRRRPAGRTPQGARLTRVFVTHMHPDHVGMAGWLTRKFDAGCG